jgi:hypothetical protein
VILPAILVAATAKRVVATDELVAATAPPVVATARPVAATAPPVAATNEWDVATDRGIVAADPRGVATDRRIAAADPRGVATDRGIVVTDNRGMATDRGIVVTDPRGVATAPRIVVTDSKIAATDDPGVVTAPRLVATASKIAATDDPSVATASRSVATASRSVATDDPGVATEPRIVATDPRIAATDDPGMATAPRIVATDRVRGYRRSVRACRRRCRPVAVAARRPRSAALCEDAPVSKLGLRRFALVLALGGGCATAPTPPSLAPGIALRWSVKQGLWGEEIFEVRDDGHAHYSFVRPGGPSSPESCALDVLVPPAAMARIAAAARRVDFCAERSKRDGNPDEGMPTLELSLPGVACMVTLWDSEWDQRPGAREVARLVSELHRHRGC